MNASSAVQAKDVVTCAAAEARLYDRQFQAKADDKFQFERHGQFGCGITSLRKVSLRRKAQAPCVADRKDHQLGKPVFNRVTGLKDSWGK